MNQKAHEIIDFWENDIGDQNWYKQSDEIDRLIANRYKSLRDEAAKGAHDDWMGTAEGALALIILLDQFSRNLYRGDAESFAADPHVRVLSREAIEKGYDQAYDNALKQFYFMPLCHSEDIADHEFLMSIAEAKGLKANMPDFYAHQEIIRRFGRFPFRNSVLGRQMTPSEQEFLDEGGYMTFRQQYIDAHPSDS